MANYLKYNFIDDAPRDIVLILPGGGYTRTSPREGSPVARLFNDHGYHSVIYYYREVLLNYEELLLESFSFIQEIKASPYVKNLIVIGFSAGGHLALSLGIKQALLIESLILFYPVVSSDEAISHKSSFINISPNNSDFERLSLDKQIISGMPRTFLVCSSDDLAVDLQNALRLMAAYHEKHNKIEAHIYEHGRHGFSIVTRKTTFDDTSWRQYYQEHKEIRTFSKMMFNFLKKTTL